MNAISRCVLNSPLCPVAALPLSRLVCMWTALVLCAGATVGAPACAAGSGDATRIPSLLAERFDYNRFSDQPARKALVALGPAGIRVVSVEGSGDQAVSEFIQDFNSDMAWLVSLERQQFVSLNLIDATVRPAETTQPAGHPTTHPSGILTTAPCLYGVAEFLGNTVWRGNRVQSWRCRSPRSVSVSRQLFHLDWQLVVREELANGDVSEIHNIEHLYHDDSMFRPAPGITEVPLVDFLSALPPIGTYEGPAAKP